MSDTSFTAAVSINKPIPVIGLIEDDHFHGITYAEIIRHTTGAVVKVFTTVQKFVEAINTGATFDVIVTDVMMRPEGVFSDEESDEGLLTGVCLAKSIREAGIACPIIIHTLSGGSRLKHIKAQFAEDENIWVLGKVDFPPHDLADFIEQLLIKPNFQSTARRYWTQFMKSLQAKPSFLGFGVDLKKLFENKR